MSLDLSKQNWNNCLWWYMPCSQLGQWVMFVLFVQLLGLNILGVGVWAWTEKDTFNNLSRLTNIALDPAFVLIVTGKLFISRCTILNLCLFMNYSYRLFMNLFHLLILRKIKYIERFLRFTFLELFLNL